MARVLAKEGDKKEAVKVLKKSIELGEAKPDGAYNFYKTRMQEQVKEWGGK